MITVATAAIVFLCVGALNLVIFGRIRRRQGKKKLAKSVFIAAIALLGMSAIIAGLLYAKIWGFVAGLVVVLLTMTYLIIQTNKMFAD